MTTDTKRETAGRFLEDTASHVLTVLHDDGLYRHLRCANPERSAYWFEVVTWPGSLAIRGDMDGGYVFSRITDMFEFFRGNGDSINPDYWAEKLSHDVRSVVRRHSEDVLRANLDPEVAEYTKRYPQLVERYETDRLTYDALPYTRRRPYAVRGMREPVNPKTPDEINELIAEYKAGDQLRFPEGARALLSELEEADVVSDAREWRLTDWDWSFLWNCHAIVLAITQYDDAKAPRAAEAVAA